MFKNKLINNAWIVKNNGIYLLSFIICFIIMLFSYMFKRQKKFKDINIPHISESFDFNSESVATLF